MADVKIRIQKNDGGFLDVEKAYLTQIEALSQSSLNPQKIEFGIIANSSQVSLVDSDNLIKNAIDNNEISKHGNFVEIYTNNKLVQTQYIQNTTYDLEKNVTIDLIGRLGIVSEYKSDRPNVVWRNILLIDYLKKIFEYCGVEVSQSDLEFMISGSYWHYSQSLYTSISDLFNREQLVAAEIKEGDTLNDLLTNICNFYLLNFYETNDGRFQFVDANLAIDNPSKVSFINRYNVIKVIDEPVFLENQLKHAEFNETIYLFSNETLPVIHETGLTFLAEKISDYSSAALYASNNYSSSDDLLASKEFAIESYNGWTILIGNKNMSNVFRFNNSLITGNIRGYYYNKVYTSGSPVYYKMDRINENSYCNSISEFKTALNTFSSSNAVAGMIIENPNAYYDKLQVVFAIKIGAFGGLFDNNFNFFLFPTQLTSSVATTIDIINTKSRKLTSGNVSDAEKTKIDVERFYSLNSWVTSDILWTKYPYGLKTKKVQLFCMNYYNGVNESGTLLKDWRNGDIFNVSDVVTFGDTYWIVTSRKFVYGSAPHLELELLEMSRNPVFVGQTVIVESDSSGYMAIPAYYNPTWMTEREPVEEIISLTNATGVRIPRTLLWIDDGAFSSSVKRVDIEDVDAWFNIMFGDINSNPITHAKNLYLNGKPIDTIKVPSWALEIYDYAFYNAKFIKKLYISKTLEWIGEQAFDGCNIDEVFYEGTEEEWNAIWNSDKIPAKTIHYNYKYII